MNPDNQTELFTYTAPHHELPRGLHLPATAVEKATAQFVDPNGIPLLKELNKAIEDEYGYPRGALGMAYRDWPFDAFADEDDDEEEDDN
ncbi:hypothetical protein ACLX1H_006658 [Fusarium chlamydosporum]